MSDDRYLYNSYIIYYYYIYIIYIIYYRRQVKKIYTLEESKYMRFSMLKYILISNFKYVSRYKNI